MDKIPFVDLKAQYNNIREEIDLAIRDILENTSFIMGEKVKNFEKEFADYCNAKNCIGVSSGTSALSVALKAANIQQGDEVITTPNTFIATAEAISEMNAKVVFADIDKDTYTIDPEKIRQKITEKTKAIMPVHLYGQPADMDPIKELAQKHNLTIIEDCAQSHGAEYKKKKVPTTDIGCFSFYPGKNLGAYGDAGAIVTNDENIAEKAAMIRDHGRKKGEKYTHSIVGSNHRIDALQAAILSVKLKHLDRWIEKRRNNARLYSELLPDMSPKEAEYAKHVYHLYVIRTKERDLLKEKLKENNISTGVHYPIPLHLQPAYQHLQHKQGDFTETENSTKEILSLPMFPELKEEHIKFIADKIKEFQQ